MCMARCVALRGQVRSGRSTTPGKPQIAPLGLTLGMHAAHAWQCSGSMCGRRRRRRARTSKGREAAAQGAGVPGVRAVAAPNRGPNCSSRPAPPAEARQKHLACRRPGRRRPARAGSRQSIYGGLRGAVGANGHGCERARGWNSVHARTYRQSQPLPLAALDPTVIGVGPESILRHGTTNAVSVWPDAWRGHETTLGRRQHLQIPMMAPDGRLWRHLRRKGARHARQRRAAGV